MDGFAAPDTDDAGSFDWRPYVAAVLRRKWILVGATLLGLLAAPAGFLLAPVEYTAEGNIWVEVDQGRSDVSPIRQSGLLQSYAWIELLTSYSVLDPVVIEERLYLVHPPEEEALFDQFALQDRFAPGEYVFSVADDGSSYRLESAAGILVQQGPVEGRTDLGEEVGFEWTLEPTALRPSMEVEFEVRPPRDAARELAERLETRMQPAGNFIGLSLVGPDPERIARILNAVMHRYVELAADLKRGKLDETLEILEEQLVYAEAALADAEVALEEFRVGTITLPTDQSTPIAPGLEITRAPVLGSFFDMKVEVEAIRRDEARMRELIQEIEETGEVPIASLEAIPVAAGNSELRSLLAELVQARAELRTLRDRYADEYPPVQELVDRIRTIQGETIPRILRGLLAEMEARSREVSARVDSASNELQAIPPRTIEEARLRRQVQIQETLYNELRQRVETARLAAASSIPDVRVLDRATVPDDPSTDRRLPFAAAALLGFMGLGVGVVVLLEWLDSRVHHPDQVSRGMGLEVLGSIPRIRPGSGKKARENALQVLEAFRELRLTIGFAYGSAGPLTLAVTSPSQEEGKSLISTNLAVSFAEMGRRTLLVDGDTRRGDANRMLGLPHTPGLSDYLRGDVEGDGVIQETDYEKLWFIGSGTRGSDTPELLGSFRMAEFFGRLKTSYDVVIVDCPPMAAGGDAILLAGMAGSIALVMRTGCTERQLAESKLDLLSRLPIRILGAILNDCEPRGVYGYYPYLSDYHAEEELDGAVGRLLSEGEVGAGHR